MSRIIKKDFGLSENKRHAGHLLTTALREKRNRKSKALRSRYAKNADRQTLFTGEKIFTVVESFNKQNDSVYSRPEKHLNSSLIIW